ncbi:MAG: tetratricopeptide repeat protein [Vicinamibacteria bacterium]
MIHLILAAGFTVIAVANTAPASQAATSTSASWACAYVSSRLPRALTLLGSDTASAEEARAARKRLQLGNAVLTRASNLAIARALRASRLVSVRCGSDVANITLDAIPYDVERPLVGAAVRVTRPAADLAGAIDEVARQLSPSAPVAGANRFRAPSAKALAKAGAALDRESVGERAAGLKQALDEDPTSLDLRLAAIDTLIAARDFEGAERLAAAQPPDDAPPSLVRALRFLRASALLDIGRYAEAAEKLEGLRREQETAAVLNNIGVVRFRMRAPAAAVPFERAAVLVDHRQRDITFNRSLALMFDGKAEQALPSLELTLRTDPTDVRTRLLRVWSLKMLGREQERGEEWGRLMAMAPSFSLLANPDLARRLERIFYSERNPES